MIGGQAELLTTLYTEPLRFNFNVFALDLVAEKFVRHIGGFCPHFAGVSSYNVGLFSVETSDQKSPFELSAKCSGDRPNLSTWRIRLAVE